MIVTQYFIKSVTVQKVANQAHQMIARALRPLKHTAVQDDEDFEKLIAFVNKLVNDAHAQFPRTKQLEVIKVNKDIADEIGIHICIAGRSYDIIASIELAQVKFNWAEAILL